MNHFLRVWLLLLITFLLVSLSAQDEKQENSPILSPLLSQYSNWNEEQPETFVLVVTDWEEALGELEKLGLQPLRYAEKATTLAIRSSPRLVKGHLLQADWLEFIDIRLGTPVEERSVRDFDLSVNRLNQLRNDQPQLRGQGMLVSIKENRFDSLDLDLRNRYQSLGMASPQISTHATTMATIIGGSGQSYYTGLGLAPEVMLTSSSFYRILPDPDSVFANQGIHTQNHSYGVDIASYYGAEARAYDQQIYEMGDLLHVFSVGNSGLQSPDHGPYTGLDGWANLTGNFKNALNVLTIGAVDSFLVLEERSSRGPVYDGRIKPELVAFGQDGSSGAAAITSGTVLLLQQAHLQQFGTPAPAALIKAVLLNSAQDIGRPGPDHEHGYGNLDGMAAMQQLQSAQWWVDSLAQGENQTYEIEIPEGVNELKLTLAWLSPAGKLDGSAALQHDLDVTLERNGEIWQPWILNTAPDSDSLALPAWRGTDRLNPQEQISLPNPQAGTYTLNIEGQQIPNGRQTFALVWQAAKANQLEWTYPVRGDILTAGRRLPLRWQSTFSSGSQGTLAFRWLGEEWQPLSVNLDLDQGYWLWSVPDTFAQGQFRIQQAGQDFVSDTVVVGGFPEISLQVDCEYEYQIAWKPVPGAAAYKVWGWQQEELMPLLTQADTILRLPKSTLDEPHVAVQPLLGDETSGRRSPSYNLDFLFAGCYLNQFILRQEGASLRLEATLGTANGVEAVYFEKLRNGQTELLGQIDNPIELTLSYLDDSPEQGPNYYRIGAQLEGTNRDMLSDTLSWLYAAPETYYVYPNPVEQGGDMVILTQDTEGAMFQLMDHTGRVVQRQGITGNFLAVSTFDLPRGIYYWGIVRRGKIEAQGKLLVQ